jgi:phytoene dehydrogenase-like protein
VHDAVVIGAGPNGLVAANLLADHGWSVLVLEEQPEPGGAVRSGELTLPGFVHDLYSAFYPLGVASPVLRALDLESHGLSWRHSEVVVAHPLSDGRCSAVTRGDPGATAATLEPFAAGDGDGWRELYAFWERVAPAFMDAFATPFPPIRPSARLVAAIGVHDALRFARTMLLSVRRLGEEHFRGAGGQLLLAGNALHADLTPDSAMGGMFGWLLASLGQEHGFPAPEGGAGQLTAALVRRLRSRGGELVCGERVERVLVRRGRAAGVRTAGGSEHGARRAVVADVGAPQLYLQLVGAEHLPERFRRSLDRFHYDNATVKVDWALSGPIPWQADDARRACTVHVTEGLDRLTRTTTQLETGLVPEEPFVVLGQYASFDPTRVPEGREVAWGYTHVPREVRGDAAGELSGPLEGEAAERFADRVEEQVERVAPGFRDLVLARHVATPTSLEEGNRNLAGGAINGGTAQVHQQLVFRPVPGLGRAETPVRGLYLGSASAHPGGGVHGVPGSNAARAALAHDRARRTVVALGASATAALVVRGARRA